MLEMLLQLLKVLIQKNVLLLDQLLLSHVKVLAVQHQLKMLKEVKNFHQQNLLNEKKLNQIDLNLELQE